MTRPRTIAIIGRPNVGKSTLFNRLIGRRKALVHDMPGVTRDRIERPAEWWVRARKLDVRLIDTGGLGGDHFAEEIRRQVHVALNEAELAILVLDGKAGLLPADAELVRELSSSGVLAKLPVIAAVNKIDAEAHETLGGEFYSLGLERMVTISAEHDRGMDELKEAVVDALAERGEAEPEVEEGAELSDAEAEAELAAEADRGEERGEGPDEEVGEELDEEGEGKSGRPPRIPEIAIVGRPNVGKSTFVNALLGEERMITSPIAGTTTDAIDSRVELGGKPYIVIDTAGIRRKNKTEQGVEVLSVVQSRKALERADLAILLLDGETGITEQDEKIGGLIEEVGCSVILAVNKWDTQENNRKFSKDDAAERIRGKMAYLRYAPIMFMSARQRKGFRDLGDLIEEILHQRSLRIPTHEFTEWVREEATVHNPANARFYLCHQSGRHPPTFVCHVNDPEKIHFSLKRHLVNALRERWGYMGTPVRLLFVEGKNRRSLPKSSKASQKPTARKTAASGKAKRPGKGR